MITTAQVANLGLASHVEFDGATADVLGSLITLSTGAGQLSGIITLQPATYRITAHLECTFTAATDAVTLQLTDGAGVAIVPASAGNPLLRVQGPAFATATGEVAPLEVIFAPVAIATIELRITALTGTLTAIGTGSEILIEQIVT